MRALIFCVAYFTAIIGVLSQDPTTPTNQSNQQSNSSLPASNLTCNNPLLKKNNLIQGPEGLNNPVNVTNISYCNRLLENQMSCCSESVINNFGPQLQSLLQDIKLKSETRDKVIEKSRGSLMNMMDALLEIDERLYTSENDLKNTLGSDFNISQIVENQVSNATTGRLLAAEVANYYNFK